MTETALTDTHIAVPLPAARPAPIAIGDLQGCCDALQRLLVKLDAGPDTPLWFAGDLVNRGPASLQTLRTVMALGSRAVAILGNHDLHVLAVAAGVQKLRRGDTIEEILNAPDAAELIDWLRHRPLAHFDAGMLMIHAGVLPQWDVAQTLELAHEVETQLRGPDWKTFFKDLYGNQPDRWDPGLKGYERWRVVVNTLTRLRFCNAAGQMEFATNGGPEAAPKGFMPWFDAPQRRTAPVTVVFGHWAAMGLVMRDNVLALDTGCVWGNKLTAVSLEADPAKRVLTQVSCPKS
jgi:bis(5'-nucleosyl)-tetraphosphatase (symmetrical)